MKTPERGKDFILAFRRLKDEKTADGLKLALQVEHTLNYDRDTDSTQTKDGAVVSSGGLEVTLSLTAISTKDPLNEMLKQSVIDGDKLEIWEIDLSSKSETGNQYDALYMRGDLNSWEVPRNVEDLVEISTEARIDGKPVAGKVTLTAEQEEEITYAFRDLTKVAE